MRVNLRLNMNHMRQSKSHSCDDVMSRVRAAHSAMRSITTTTAESPRLSSRHCVYRCQRSWRMRQGWSLCGCDSMTLSWRVIAVTALVIQEQHEREQNNWIQDQLQGNATIILTSNSKAAGYMACTVVTWAQGNGLLQLRWLGKEGRK